MSHLTPKNATPAGQRLSALLLASALALGAALGGAGCKAVCLETPESFVSMERVRTRLYYKAVSPDNAVITVSSFEHKDKGNLEYWTEILKREMTLRKGYTLKSTEPVKAKGGLVGRRLVFHTQSGSTKFLYACNLFVTKKYIHVMETAAKEADYPKHQAAFDTALGSLEPR